MEQIYQRIQAKIIRDWLKIIGCVVIEGPKQSGKTFLAQKLTNSQYFVAEQGINNELIVDLPYENHPIFTGKQPRLIDEWQIVPKIWDKVRFLIDQSQGQKGLYILTGSANPNYQKLLHNGAGRMLILRMHTLTFREILFDQPEIKLSDLFAKKPVKHFATKYQLHWITQQLIKGGWPATITSNNNFRQIASYVESWLRKDFLANHNFKVDKNLFSRIIRSLARLNTTQLKKTTILKDLNYDIDVKTLTKYLNLLEDQYAYFELPIWNETFNLRSKTPLLTKPKFYWSDPSLGLNILKIKQPDQLFADLNTLGIYFENQVIKDLMTYAQVLDGQLYFYRDTNGFEIDAIMQLDIQTWAAFEIKLKHYDLDQSAANLIKFAKKMQTYPPTFLMIITAGDHTYQRPDGVYVVPHTCLGI